MSKFTVTHEVGAFEFESGDRSFSANTPAGVLFSTLAGSFVVRVNKDNELEIYDIDDESLTIKPVDKNRAIISNDG